MLYVGTLLPSDSTSLLPLNNAKFPSTGPFLPFISKTTLFLSSSNLTNRAQLSFKTTHNALSLLRVSAKNKTHREGGGGGEVMETEHSDFDGVEDSDEDNDGDGDDDEDEGIPFGKMKNWLENKPRGFGEGKLYDTSIEDKLFQELEQSRKAQIANINRLKNEPPKPSSKNDAEMNKAPEDIPSGIRVRLFNLPKKKNIHRDLKLAFEGVPGIINIIPAVSGNKKTKDPVCKGFAFVDFKSAEYATRFLQSFSRKSIAFGKVQKQIRCEMMNSSSSNSVDGHSADDTDSDSKQTINGFVEDSITDLHEDENSFVSVMEAASDGSPPDNELDFAEVEDIRESLEFVTVSELNGSDNRKKAKKSATDSSSANQLEKIQAVEKKLIAKGKVKEAPKLDTDFAELEDVRESLNFVTVSEFNGSDKTKKAKEPAIDSSSSNQSEKIQEIEKKLIAKAKMKEAPKLDIDFAELEDVIESPELATVSELNVNDNTKGAKESTIDSSPSNQQKKIKAIEKKAIGKGKVKRTPKLNILGSSQRLKIKEKAVLTAVFSKYALKAASTSKEESQHNLFDVHKDGAEY